MPNFKIVNNVKAGLASYSANQEKHTILTYVYA